MHFRVFSSGPADHLKQGKRQSGQEHRGALVMEARCSPLTHARTLAVRAKLPQNPLKTLETQVFPQRGAPASPGDLGAVTNRPVMTHATRGGHHGAPSDEDRRFLCNPPGTGGFSDKNTVERLIYPHVTIMK